MITGNLTENSSMTQLSSFKKMVQTPPNKKSDNKLQSLWQLIEKHQKRNAAFTKKLAANYQQFEEVVLPYEQTQIMWLGSKVDHLASFLVRKSLSEAERVELTDWISEELGYLQEHPFNSPEAFEQLNKRVKAQLLLSQQQQLDKISSAELAQLKDSLSAEFDTEFDLSDDEFKALILDPNKIYEYLDAHEASEEAEETDELENDEEDIFDDHFFNDFYQRFHQSDEQDKAEEKLKHSELDKLFKGSQLNKMYKRLASKLHPDKELDPKLKQQKHLQMQVLAEARRHKDVFTILQLYLSHFDDDPTFDKATLTNLLPLLEEKVRNLNAEYRALQHNDQIETLVWRKFKARSKKLIREEMEAHCHELDSECAAIDEFIRDCTTVKSIKAELRARINDKNTFGNPFADFDEFAKMFF